MSTLLLKYSFPLLRAEAAALIFQVKVWNVNSKYQKWQTVISYILLELIEGVWGGGLVFMNDGWGAVNKPQYNVQRKQFDGHGLHLHTATNIRVRFK